jgi:hypothetical protein
MTSTDQQGPARHAPVFQSQPLPPWVGWPYRANPDRGQAAIWTLSVAGAFLVVMGLLWMFSQKTLAAIAVYPLAAGVVVCGVVCGVGAVVIGALR